MPKIYQNLLIGFVIVFGIILFPSNIFGQIILEERCLGDENAKKLDFDLTVGVREFDEIFKEAVITFDIDAEDDETTEPFEIHMKRYPYTGGRIINVEANDEGYHEVTSQKIVEHRMIPQHVSDVSNWPFEEYTFPIFLEFNQNVQLCFNESVEKKGEGDIHIYEEGFFHENPDWRVDLTYSKSSPAELEETIPDAKSYFNSSVFRFDSTISHPEGYQNKLLLYAAIVLVPIILIIGHALFVRTPKLSSHITFFTGVSILILTGIVLLTPLTPKDVTLLELVSIGSVAVYAVGFSVFLAKRRLTNSITNREKRRIQALPKKLDTYFKE